MIEHPILFNAQMVRAILEGRKTQTRRVVKLGRFWGDTPIEGVSEITPGFWQFRSYGGGEWTPTEASQSAAVMGAPCPYGQPGDSLWVRETFLEFIPEHQPPKYVYRADMVDVESEQIRKEYGYMWKPSIHMPLRASRITLEILSIRVERVQDISAIDAMWEGIEKAHARLNRLTIEILGNDSGTGQAVIRDFSLLWDSINAKRGYSWASNPWVWVIEFKQAQ